MKAVLLGQKWLGEAALDMLIELGVEVCAVVAPPGSALALKAQSAGIATPPPGDKGRGLENLPECDFIVCAHYFGKVADAVLAKARFGAIGYHPSLLPLYRGRSAVSEAIGNGESVTGGTVYLLDHGWDTGPVLLQDWCFIKRGETPAELWRRALAPMGVELLSKAAAHLLTYGFWPEPVDQQDIA